jgi:hypothetical protein
VVSLGRITVALPDWTEEGFVELTARLYLDSHGVGACGVAEWEVRVGGTVRSIAQARVVRRWVTRDDPLFEDPYVSAIVSPAYAPFWLDIPTGELDPIPTTDERSDPGGDIVLWVDPVEMVRL